MAMPQLRWLAVGFPPWWHGFDHRSGHVGLMTDKTALGQVFSKYFSFPCQFSLNKILHTQSSKAGTICQLVAKVPSVCNPIPPHENKKNHKMFAGRNCKPHTQVDDDVQHVGKLLRS
jgi:hypothetical protein